MVDERMYPVLPCADLDAALAFYSALGFTTTFTQRRPNPCAVVAREDMAVHLAEIDGFDPAGSYASVIVTVPNPEALHADFATGLRQVHGRIPVKGIPRLLPPRRKAGTATGFSVVDVGGNWLRFYRSAQEKDDADEERTGLGRVIDVAARQGDARGDDIQAIAVLTAGLTRHASSAAPHLVLEALLYRAELRTRIGESTEKDLATASHLIATHELGQEAEDSLARAILSAREG